MKSSTSSGGRGTIVSLLRKKDGSINQEDEKDLLGEISVYGFDSTVDFILREIAPMDDVVIQEFIESDPREFLSEEGWHLITQRFTRLGISIDEDTPLYWNFRNYVTRRPEGEPQIVGWIMLIHVKAIANVGQGGQLFHLTPDMLKPQYRHILEEMARVSKAMTWAIEYYSPILAEKIGLKIGHDATGTPYSRPLLNLSDLMLKKEGEKWTVVPLEENIGMGLFYPYEQIMSSKGMEGSSVDPIINNLAYAGDRYRKIITAEG
ncbi:MAG TPA: hypothetical protein ENF41_01310 [Candidatus Bathyarchaeota archaeon]|nr:hypothetical protein [Candidatus Bathyarchaeota archaeon]